MIEINVNQITSENASNSNSSSTSNNNNTRSNAAKLDEFQVIMFIITSFRNDE